MCSGIQLNINECVYLLFFTASQILRQFAVVVKLQTRCDDNLGQNLLTQFFAQQVLQLRVHNKIRKPVTKSGIDKFSTKDYII